MSVTCLIVDDDPEILEYVASHIEKEGYHLLSLIHI